MFSLEERKRAVELYPTTSTTTAEVVEHLGYPTRQCLDAGWRRIPLRWAYQEPHHPPGNRAEGDRTGIGRHAAEASRPAARRGDSPDDDGDVEAPRRRAEELELKNALMREWPMRSPRPRVVTGTAGSRPRPEPASRRR